MLKVRNLTKKFNKHLAVDNVSFSLGKNETMVIIGQSGSGKTTLLRMLNQLEKPTSGEIEGGTFGLVFQDFHLFPQYTVLQNLTLAPKLLKKDYSFVGEFLGKARKLPGKPEELDGKARELRRKAEELLGKMRILDKKDSFPHELSGGQKQRTAIARALMLKSDVLCFDELTSALDPQTTYEIIDIIKNLKKEQSMIIVTHNLDVCSELADKTAIMEKGKLTWSI